MGYQTICAEDLRTLRTASVETDTGGSEGEE